MSTHYNIFSLISIQKYLQYYVEIHSSLLQAID